MRKWTLSLALLAASLPLWAQTPTPQALAPDVWWIPGSLLPKRQPDGNSLVLRGKDGLIVLDTGRHAWQTQAILDLAKAQKAPIVAIVNSHWHLDHVSGNPALKAAHPQAQVYASDAIDGALNGFLKDSMAGAADYVKTAGLPPETAEDIRLDMASIANGAALKPDQVLRASETRELAGRRLELYVAKDAVTAADVWLYDPATKIVAVGDLVTLPVPFLDTACVDGWQAALKDIASRPFTTLLPGHGQPMDRAAFERYHAAFNAFVQCARSDTDAQACASRWQQDVQAENSQRMAIYYVTQVLRANGGNSKSCRKQNP